MSAGLWPLSVIAEFLGKRPEHMPGLIADDGLPVINVPTCTKNVQKVSLLGFHRWLRSRSRNAELTVAELEQELERASQAISARIQAKQERRKTREAAVA